MSDGPKSSRTSRGSKGSRSVPGKVSFGDYQFINLELLAAEREGFLEWRQEQPPVAEYLDFLLADGCKVSFTLDPNGGGVLCSASQSRANHENAGAILTGRGGDATTALSVLQYKDTVLSSGIPWRQCAEERRRGKPDIG